MSPASQPAGPTRRQWLLLVCLFLLSLPAVTPRIYSSDEVQYFAFLRSMWFDRDLSFDNEYRYFYDRGVAKSDGFRETFLEQKTDTGRRINFGTVGCAILWAPFYGAGDAVAWAIAAPRDGFSKPYLAAVAYASTLYGCLALVLAILCAERLGLNGFLPAIAIWLGTPLLFYMYVAPPFSHACSAFGVALFTYVWLRIRDRWSIGGLIALGASGALMAMIREQDALLVAAPAVDFIWSAVSGPSRAPEARARLGAALAGCVAFLVVFTPQAATYLILNGHLGPHASVAHKMTWTAPHALQVLFSPEHGLFVWTPLALMAIAGLVGCLWPPPRGSAAHVPHRAAVCLLLMVAVQIFSAGSVQSWTVAGAFGQRRFIALTTALVIGLAALDDRARAASWRPTRGVLALILVTTVYWNLALIAEFATGLMDRQKLEPRRNAYHAFVTLPRTLPSLAYRYLFDRRSFYQHGS